MKIVVGNHSKFIPIVKALAAGGHEIITLHPSFTKTLTDIEVNAKSLVDYLDESGRSAAFQYAAEVLGNLKRSIPADMRLDKEPRRFMNEGVGGFLYSRLADVSAAVAAMQKAQPDFAMVQNDVDPLTRSIALWCKANNKPCLHVPHSVYINVGRESKPGTDIHDVVSASHLASSGAYQTEWYKERGFPADHIRETGLPQFDAMAVLSPDRDRSCRLLGLDPGRPVITYASSWRQDTNLLGCHDGVEEYYVKCLNAVKQLQGVQFIVKIHPHSNSIAWHAEQAKAVGVDALIVGAHLEVVLQASDLLLAYSASNILMEGSFIPWLRLMTSHGYEDDAAITKLGEDATPEYIAKQFAMSLSKPAVNAVQFRNKYCGITDGMNSARIVDYIGEICQ